MRIKTIGGYWGNIGQNVSSFVSENMLLVDL